MESWLLSSCSKEEGQSPFSIVSIFLASFFIFYYSLFRQIKKKKESFTMAVSFSFILGVARIFRALKHLIGKNKGTSSPSR